MTGDTDRRTVLQIADLTSQSAGLATMFHGSVRALEAVIALDFLNRSLHDPGGNMPYMDLSARAGIRGPTEANNVPVDGSLTRWMWQNQRSLALNGVDSETRFRSIACILTLCCIRSSCTAPLETTPRRSGSGRFEGKKAIRPKLISNSRGRPHARLRWL